MAETRPLLDQGVELGVAFVAPGKQYATLQDLKDIVDIPRMTIQVEEWSTPERPFYVEVSGLTGDEQRTIELKAKDEWDTVKWIVRYGLKQPQLSDEHIELLGKKSRQPVLDLAATITALSTFSVEYVTNYVEREAQRIREARGG